MKSLARVSARMGALALMVAAAVNCSSSDSSSPASQEPNDGPNPFLEESTGKADTGYLNLAGLEVEVTIEADVKAPSYSVLESPPYLLQYAVTYLRKSQDFYLQLLAEDETAPDRVEWLVDGQWLTAAQAQSVDKAKLTHFRMQGCNAVALNGVAKTIKEGQVITAPVPVSPYNVWSEAGDTCGEVGGHIGLSQSTYWYLWEPDKEGCKATLQDMKITVTKLTPKNPPSYPEYDQLWADKNLSVVVLFGKLDDGNDIKKDWNWGAADRFVQWLKDAKFTEQTDAPKGRRFSKTIGDKTETVDVYYPDLFRDMTDTSNMANWQKAQSEHEVVIYLGHSVLGTGSVYDDVKYPDTYQIQFIGGCLGWEYYVRPVLAGKGGWEKVDAAASIVENMYTEMNPATGAFLAKLFWGFEHNGNASWQEIMAAINNRLGHAHFGVSGARGNCFSPDGIDKCVAAPTNPNHWENTTAAPIPDADPKGAVSTINVPDALKVGTLTVSLDIAHTYVGDLQITLSHGGKDFVMRDHVGGSQDDVHGKFTLDAFNGLDAKGDWTLKVVDTDNIDTGTLNSWAIDIVAAQ